jgi:hypothetical protein
MFLSTTPRSLVVTRHPTIGATHLKPPTSDREQLPRHFKRQGHRSAVRYLCASASARSRRGLMARMRSSKVVSGVTLVSINGQTGTLSTIPSSSSGDATSTIIAMPIVPADRSARQDFLSLAQFSEHLHRRDDVVFSQRDFGFRARGTALGDELHLYEILHVDCPLCFIDCASTARSGSSTSTNIVHFFMMSIRRPRENRCFVCL